MALTGDFKETPFADLLQFYSISKQTVAIIVSVPGSQKADGVFYVDNGDLVGAFLSGLAGREAVRRALRLRQGKFRVDPGVKPPDGASHEQWRNILLEELVQLDEENRAAAAAGGAGGADPAAPGGEPAPASAGAGSRAGTPGTPGPAGPRVGGATGTPGPSGPRVGTSKTPGPGGPRVSPGAASGGARPSGSSGPAVAQSPGRAAGSGGGAGSAGRPGGPARTPSSPPGGGGGASRRMVVVAAVGVALIGLAAVAGYVALGRKSPGSAAAGHAAAGRSRGVTSDEITLGMVASFSGSNKERGRAMRVGWEVAIAGINEAGGINGRKLRLVAYDDGYDPQRTLPAMKQVVEGDGSFAVVGNVGTATAAVSVPYIMQQKLVFYGPLSGADLLRKSPPDRYVFNFRAGLAREGAAAVRYLAEVRRIDPRRIAVLVQADDFGESGWRGAAKQLESKGVPTGEILKLSYPRNTADVRDALAKLREHAKEIDAVVLVATYKPAATFIRKTKDAGLSLLHVTVSADSNGLAEELVESGKGFTDNVLVTQVVPVPTGKATALLRYQQALEKYAPGEKPGSTTLESWIGAQIFFEALKRTGRDLDSEGLVKAFEAMQEWDLGIGAPIRFSPANHQGCDTVWGWQLQPDGTYRQVDLE